MQIVKKMILLRQKFTELVVMIVSSTFIVFIVYMSYKHMVSILLHMVCKEAKYISDDDIHVIVVYIYSKSPV